MSEITGYNIHFFRELALVGHGLYSWTLDRNFTRVSTNCPYENVAGLMFSLDSFQEEIRIRFSEGKGPVAVTNELGLMVMISCEYGEDSAPAQYHILGPAFYDSVSAQEISQAVRAKNLSSSLREEFLSVIGKMTLISLNGFGEYGLMQHFAVTGERATRADIRFIRQERRASPPAEKSERKSQRGLYAAEQAMLKMIENGVLDFTEQHDRTVALSNIESLGYGSPLRQNKDLMIVLSSLASHAAINGGVLPETAQELSNEYNREIERAQDMYELTEVNRRMLADFTGRVHREKLRRGLSPQIKKCCDYIQLNVEKRITVSELASVSGYNEKYLSHKFTKMMKKSLTEYIAEAKVERAKLLLLDSDMTIQEIAITLNFSSQSHFGSVFKKQTGISPGEYRMNRGA